LYFWGNYYFIMNPEIKELLSKHKKGLCKKDKENLSLVLQSYKTSYEIYKEYQQMVEGYESVIKGILLTGHKEL